MELSPRTKGPALPLSSLRLFVPPLRLMSGWMWQVAEQRNIVHYGKLEEFVTLVTEMVPDLLSYKRRAQLVLGLRARLVLEMCRDDPPADLKTVQPHLDRIRRSAEPAMHGGSRDPEVEAAEGNFLELIQTLLGNPEDREHFFQFVFPKQYGPKYETALQILVWEFLSRLEQLLPVPDFRQTASWLRDYASVWEDSLQSVSNSEHLKDLLQHHQSLGHLEKAHSCNFVMGDAILSTLSCPLTVREVIAFSEKTKSDIVGSRLDENECTEDGAVKNSGPERDRDGSEGLFNEVGVEEEEEESGKSFTNKTVLRRYQTTHTEERPFSCTECGKSCSSASSLKGHQRMHSVVTSKRYSCTHCGKSFRSITDLRRHQRTHTEERPFSCTECGNSYKSAGSLKIHQRIHTGERPYLCSYCGRSFVQADSLQAHLRIHTGERPYSCSHCGKSFTQANILVRHTRMHTGERPYLCKTCRKTFFSSRELSSHTRIHTGQRPYQCLQCGKCFAKSSTLLLHQRTHTGERPYSCTCCTKRFTSSSALHRHIRVHTGEKPYQCSTCGKRFALSSNMRIHQRVHR